MPISFVLNGQPVKVDGLPPTTTLLDWLRATGRAGTKEGCAEGDCGACTVALLDGQSPGGPTWKAVCSCIVLLPQVADHELVTVEGLADGDALHPAQQAMVDALGSQCGYCTPGFVMALFEGTYRDDLCDRARKDDQICGNLCRCTGYRPIREALDRVAGAAPDDRFRARLTQPVSAPGEATLEHDGETYLRPDRWESLWDALDGGARLVAGATDLGLDVTQRHARFDRLVDLLALPGFRDLHDEGGSFTLGAGVRLSDLERWSEAALPALARMLRFFGSRQIKNRGTLGGNLCTASPIGDIAPVLLALDASAILRSRAGDRVVPMSEFFLSYRQTALREGEVLAAVSVPKPHPDARIGAYKVSKRRELDISGISAAFLVIAGAGGRCHHARLAYGGMAATPARALHAETALTGRIWEAAAVEGACSSLLRDFTPIDDHRASAWYRNTVAANLLRGFFEETREQGQLALPARPTATVLPGDVG
jgi:xanthine dehydrogenase small subunit